VKKPQFILAGAGLLVLIVLYFGGNTIPPKKNSESKEQSVATKAVDIQDILQAWKSKLTPSQLSYVNRLENSVVRGDVRNQQLTVYKELAVFWKDSVQQAFLPQAYYEGEVAKLEKSEKKLTFAAQLFLENLRGQDDPSIKTWVSTEAKELFEAALAINPRNDSARVGLGATYIFGNASNSPQETMQGVQQILQVVKEDSTNMYAQFMLGLGGMESGQFDRAIARFTKVIEHQPDNLEAILSLAEAYERTGNKKEALNWYSAAKKKTGNKELLQAIDTRIKSLK